jgi:hypothetical protein
MPTPKVDWAEVERRILREADGVVIRVSYDEADDFLTVEVTDETSAATAAILSCNTVLPALNAEGALALWALYSESGHILASWNRCQATPAPISSAGPSAD